MSIRRHVFGVVILMLAAGLPAMADIYTFTNDHCSSPGCGTNLGTVTVTQNGTGDVHLVVAATGTGFSFVNSTSHGDNFLFDIGAVSGGNLDNPTISATFVTSGWQLVSTTAGSLGGGVELRIRSFM